jgi:hypothetical protein
MRAWHQIHPTPTPWFVVGAGEEIAPELKRRIAADARTARRAMYAVASIMHGEQAGYLPGQDVLAASLYRAWKLDPDAALSILRSAVEPVRVRNLAVRALEHRWHEEAFAHAATGALCVLAAHAAQTQLIAADSVRNDAANLLTKDESDLLLEVVYALDSGQSKETLNAIINFLPAGNPVTRQVIRQFTPKVGNE